MNLWQQNRRRTSQANFLQKSPLKPRGIFLYPKRKEGKMNKENIIRDTVLMKLRETGQRGSLTEIRRPDLHHTLETEYRIMVTEHGSTIYRITRTEKEHDNYFICGAGPAFRYSNRTSIWDQEIGRGATKYRYSETLSRRKITDPNGPWETTTQAYREVTDPTELPTTNLPTAGDPEHNLNKERDCQPGEKEEKYYDSQSEALREAEKRKARIILRAHHAGQKKRREKEAERTR